MTVNIKKLQRKKTPIECWQQCNDVFNILVVISWLCDNDKNMLPSLSVTMSFVM